MTCNRIVKRGLLGVLAVACATSLAAPAATPPCGGERYRDFDFWLGDWVVELANGVVAGRNVISPAHGGCLLTEQWTSARGGTGSSMNFYDAGRGLWRQIWVSPGAVIDVAGGLEGEGAERSMVLSGSIYYEAQDVTVPFRGRWTPLPDGRVRQFFEEARETGQWTPWFEGFYRRPTSESSTTPQSD